MINLTNSHPPIFYSSLVFMFKMTGFIILTLIWFLSFFFLGRTQVVVRHAQNWLKRGAKDKNMSTESKIIENAQPSQRILQTLTNYVLNGDFSNTSCTDNNFCWDQGNFQSTYIYSWLPDPQIEIGWANFYNGTQKNKFRVVDIAVSRPSCLKQYLRNLPNGYYHLNYTFAPRTSIKINQSKIQAYLGGVLIDSRLGTTYAWNYASVTDIKIEGVNGTNSSSMYLRFCGDTTVGNEGDLLGNISLVKTRDLPAVVVPTTPSDPAVNNTQTSPTPVNNSNSNSQTSVNPSPSPEPQPQPESQTQQQSQQQKMLNPNKNELAFYSSILGYLFPEGVISSLVKIPVARQLVFGLCSFFINLDHLELYFYHQRNYSTYLQDIFIKIRNLQTTKWDLASNQVQNYVFNFDSIQNQLNQKLPQTKLYYRILQGKSSQFLVNNYKFFIVNTPFVLLIFFIIRLSHKLSLKCGFDNFFQEYSFNFTLIIIFLEGNSQFFVYCLLFDLKTLFTRDHFMKLTNLLSIICLFVLCFLLLSSGLIFRYLQVNEKKKMKLGNCKDNLRGNIIFMVEFGLFNILLGSVHILAQDYLDFQLFLIILFEISFLWCILLNLRNKVKVFEENFRVFLTLGFSLLRIFLIASIYLYQEEFNDIKDIVEQCQQVFILIYLLLMVLGFVVAVLQQIVGVFKEIIGRIRSSSRRANKVASMTGRLGRKDQKTVIKVKAIQKMHGSSNNFNKRQHITKILKDFKIKKERKKEDSIFKQVSLFSTKIKMAATQKRALPLKSLRK